MRRRHFVGSGLAIAAGWPLRGFTSVLKGVWDVPAKGLAGWTKLAPRTQGFYTNYVDPDVTMAGYRDNYGANFERLVTVKAKYDPNNLFRLNANVPPKIG